MRLALLLLPSVNLAETAVVVVSQTAEVTKGHHLQVGPRREIGQLLADGIEDADSRLLLDAFGKRLFLSLCLLLRGRLVSGHVVVNGALIVWAEVENGSSTLAVDENSGLRGGTLLITLPSPVINCVGALRIRDVIQSGFGE